MFPHFERLPMALDDSQLGVRNRRGDWTPIGQREIAPFWVWPPQPLKVLQWIPGYLWPWNAFHLATALLCGSSACPTWRR
jgi:hypothetical protein